MTTSAADAGDAAGGRRLGGDGTAGRAAADHSCLRRSAQRGQARAQSRARRGRRRRPIPASGCDESCHRSRMRRPTSMSSRPAPPFAAVDLQAKSEHFGRLPSPTGGVSPSPRPSPSRRTYTFGDRRVAAAPRTSQDQRRRWARPRRPPRPPTASRGESIRGTAPSRHRLMRLTRMTDASMRSNFAGVRQVKVAISLERMPRIGAWTVSNMSQAHDGDCTARRPAGDCSDAVRAGSCTLFSEDSAACRPCRGRCRGRVVEAGPTGASARTCPGLRDHRARMIARVDGIAAEQAHGDAERGHGAPSAADVAARAEAWGELWPVGRPHMPGRCSRPGASRPPRSARWPERASRGQSSTATVGLAHAALPARHGGGVPTMFAGERSPASQSGTCGAPRRSWASSSRWGHRQVAGVGRVRAWPPWAL